MEFKFNVIDVFKHPIVAINNTLVPPGFSGDKRALWDTQSKVSQVINAMGEASAAAQGLTKPITTAERLRNSEHRLYLLIDQTANGGKGAVTGMLKTGAKGLYVFDREGQAYQVSPPCVLDFYVHESRQRTGLGKRLFEHMLETEQSEPVKMAIDRPSEKFLGFLNKHYNLHTPVKQMNNFVVFDGFFQKSVEPKTVEVDTSSASRTPSKKQSANGLQHLSSPYGRYGAPRPPCSMGQIIHNDTSVVNKGLHEPSGVKSAPATNIGNQVYSQNPYTNFTQSTPNVHYGNNQSLQYQPTQSNDPTLSQIQANINATQPVENHPNTTSLQVPNRYQMYQTQQAEQIQNMQQALPQQIPSGYYENQAYGRGDMSIHQHNVTLNQTAGQVYPAQSQMQSAIDQNIQKLNKQDHAIRYTPVGQSESSYQQIDKNIAPANTNIYNQQNLPQPNNVEHDVNQGLYRSYPQATMSSPEFNTGYNANQIASNVNPNVSHPNLYKNTVPNTNNVPHFTEAPVQQNPNTEVGYAQQLSQGSQDIVTHPAIPEMQQNVHRAENQPTGNPNDQQYAAMSAGAYGDIQQENIAKPSQSFHQPNSFNHPNEYHQHPQYNLPITRIAGEPNIHHQMQHTPSTPLQQQQQIPQHIVNTNNQQFSPDTTKSIPHISQHQIGYTHQPNQQIYQNQISSGENTNMPISRPISGTNLSNQQADPRYAMTYPQLQSTKAPTTHPNQNMQYLNAQQNPSININNNQINPNTVAEKQNSQAAKYDNAVPNLSRNIGYDQLGNQANFEEGTLVHGYPPQCIPQEKQLKSRSIVKIIS